MIFHDRTNLERQGYEATGEPFPDMPSIAAMQNMAYKLNVCQEALTAFRLAPGVWQSFYVPGVERTAYISHPILPPA